MKRLRLIKTSEATADLITWVRDGERIAGVRLKTEYSPIQVAFLMTFAATIGEHPTRETLDAARTKVTPEIEHLVWIKGTGDMLENVE